MVFEDVMREWCASEMREGKGYLHPTFPLFRPVLQNISNCLAYSCLVGGAFCENTLTYGNNQGFPANPEMFYENLDAKNHSKKSMFAKCQRKFAISGKFNRDL